ncbi:ABC transporter ATP-binding protein [Leucobacter weissii]|uniref:ABC transporter ATP-binding protein n=1 Tax=Leucobacter weissii TaxID=1983706 RepID=A0A939SBJ8_9MICO|nr:ABC transporter ATP-binding protein [Leucobacter weissii]MBO1903057.1 ABC transporter ATP-binding protein [Leucobacter weissii]
MNTTTLPTPAHRSADPATASDRAVIELREARKVYRTGEVSVEALRGIDLSIAAGDYVAIMGPSGSGKSTLMHALGCLDVLTSGSYRLDGVDVSELDDDALAEIRNLKIGFVFQQFHLLPELTAWQNVALPLMYARVPLGERRERAAAALDSVGLGGRADHRPGELSGGQQQRVAVARALVTEPTMVLADEPTGNLDTASTEDVLELFDQLNGLGRTIVLITHETEVGEHAKRIVWVKDGVIDREQVNRA